MDYIYFKELGKDFCVFDIHITEALIIAAEPAALAAHGCLLERFWPEVFIQKRPQ
jgi:hypothetical protein